MRYLILLAVFYCLAGVVYSDTLHAPSDYSTIQDAINAAAVGDTLLVHDGTYTMKPQFLRKVKRKSCTRFH